MNTVTELYKKNSDLLFNIYKKNIYEYCKWGKKNDISGILSGREVIGREYKTIDLKP